jgi:hypothetical protein
MWIPVVNLAYRIRFYVPLSLATIKRSFRIFRQSIYDESLQQKEIKKSSGEIEIDEALYSVDIGRGVSMVWEPKEKTLVFGIYQRN